MLKYLNFNLKILNSIIQALPHFAEKRSDTYVLFSDWYSYKLQHIRQIYSLVIWGCSEANQYYIAEMVGPNTGLGRSQHWSNKLQMTDHEVSQINVISGYVLGIYVDI